MYSKTLLSLSILLSGFSPLLAVADSSNLPGSFTGFETLADLHKGNERFLGAGSRKREAINQMVEDSSPPFMFLGCTDNRFSPASIFQAPIGSIVTQNNIGNQYSKKDTSTDAAITYAIEDLGVQHIIVLGHYGCPGLQKAVVASSKDSNSVMKWLRPITDFYKTVRRREIVRFRDARLPHRGQPNGVTDPPSEDEEGFRALVEENVKRTVKALKEESVLAREYQRGAKSVIKETKFSIFVHGFVLDEETGKITNLNISFGPPGEPIPDNPFAIAEQARNIHREKHLPMFNKGKNV